MNKWKISFGFCLTLLIAMILFAAYSIIDQAYTITNHKVSFEDIKNDLDHTHMESNKKEYHTP